MAQQLLHIPRLHNVSYQEFLNCLGTLPQKKMSQIEQFGLSSEALVLCLEDR